MKSADKKCRISRHINVCKLKGLPISICRKHAVGGRFNLRSNNHMFTKRLFEAYHFLNTGRIYLCNYLKNTGD